MHTDSATNKFWGWMALTRKLSEQLQLWLALSIRWLYTRKCSIEVHRTTVMKRDSECPLHSYEDLSGCSASVNEAQINSSMCRLLNMHTYWRRRMEWLRFGGWPPNASPSGEEARSPERAVRWMMWQKWMTAESAQKRRDDLMHAITYSHCMNDARSWKKKGHWNDSWLIR